MNEFEEIMGKQTDAALLKILKSQPGDYQPAALEAAQNEFEKRNLSNQQVISAEKEIEHEQQLKEYKADQPLNIGFKILTFIFPGIFTLIVGGALNANGQKRKYKDLLRWTFYGIGFYVGLFILINILARF